jgi:hypothetical protein
MTTQTEDTCHWCERIIEWDLDPRHPQGVELVPLDPVTAKAKGPVVNACIDCAEAYVGRAWGVA